jgi:uncharacterized protein involved in exopolysaccharide biosynthesis
MTPNPVPRPPSEAEAPADSADLFDYELIRDYLGFALRSFRRHRVLAVGSFLAVVVVSALALAALPKTYHTETKILAERNQVMPALGNPSRAIPQDADAPTRAASEIILRRDNLVALIKQTDLLDQWDATRAPASRAKDAALRLFQGAPDDEARIDALAGLLEKRLKVETGEGTVTIGIDWPNAQMAFRLVEAAQQNFLEARHAMEVSTIAEAISILEGHAANVRESIYGELEELKRLREAHAKNLPISVIVRTPAQAGRSQAEQDLAQVRVMLVAKRRAIADLEDFRARRLQELQSQLAEQKTTYAAAHPIVVNTEQQISALGRESPQIAQLRREEQELLRDYARQGGKQDELNGTAAPLPRLPEGVRDVKHAAPDPQDDEATDYEKTRLRIAVNKYEELLGRIEAARIELDTARAAFKYRYSIVRPAQVPKHAEKPNPVVMILGGVMGGFLLALCLCLLKDVARGRFVERWQIERWLKVPVLAEVDRP